MSQLGLGALIRREAAVYHVLMAESASIIKSVACQVVLLGGRVLKVVVGEALRANGLNRTIEVDNGGDLPAESVTEGYGFPVVLLKIVQVPGATKVGFTVTVRRDVQELCREVGNQGLRFFSIRNHRT